MPVGATVTKILVADDDADFGDILAFKLERAGHEVTVVHDGSAALELATQVRFDLLVLDCQMPGRTGLQVLAALRSDQAQVTLPIVLMSAHPITASAIDQEVASLADAYLQKPFSLSSLCGQVQNLIPYSVGARDH